uniref:Uncharacterized protein n=1 Tax=Magallana gigas TaxID=29159 RepID=K1QTT8_MAGGI
MGYHLPVMSNRAPGGVSRVESCTLPVSHLQCWCPECRLNGHLTSTSQCGQFTYTCSIRAPIWI